jgi:uncharacterized protein with von Willebrand factor type A (vWA) domain
VGSGGNSMEARLVEFVGVLRRNGIRVSTAETLDALRVTDLAGLTDRTTFKNALRAAMVKRNADLETYDGLFDAYFSGLSNLVSASAQAGQGGGTLSEEELRALLESLEDLLRSMEEGEISELTRALMMQDRGALEQMLREMMEAGKLPNVQTNYVPPGVTRDLMEMAGASGLGEEIDKLLEAAAEAGMGDAEREQLRDYMAQRAKDLAEMLKGLLKLDREQSERSEEREKDRDRLLEKSFYYLSPAEIKKMREAVAALARKLKNVMAVRYRHSKRGRLDVRDTLRRSMEYGGVPFKIRFDVRRKERPQVVILCDVSDSVRNVSRFMLQFVHSLQDMYSRVRSYVFVADIGEVTKLFKDNEIQSAINKAINGDVVNVYAHSDFGRAFQQFHRDHLEVVDSRTTLIILGDARNNYNAPNDWVLRDIRERARQVIWLNPENSSTWGFGDSEMSLYSKHCDHVQECRNLRQLYKVVDLLVAR